MTYEETLSYLFSRLPMFQRIGAAAYKANLNNTLAMDAILDHPHRKINCIHVAGTNGKGSTSHFLASIFQESGYKTGLYTSPHLIDFRERIKVNGELIPTHYVVDFVEKYKMEFEKIEPSFFEWTVALAFDYFAHEKVEIAIIETGMGGRLDSTNIITPLLSIITNISYDHKQFLGDTLEKIAFEKAGIIKKYIPIIIGETQTETAHVFAQKANQVEAEITFADQNISCHRTNNTVVFEVCIRQDGKLLYENLRSGLIGNYQLKNIPTVIASIQKIRQLFNQVTDISISNGIKNVVENTGLMGRWQKINETPLAICDTGHNVAGISEIIAQLNELKVSTVHFVLGFVGDKEVGEIVELLPTKDNYFFCQPSIPRAMKIDVLKGVVSSKLKYVQYFENVELAYQAALSTAKSNEVVFVGGSTFVVADLLSTFYGS